MRDHKEELERLGFNGRAEIIDSDLTVDQKNEVYQDDNLKDLNLNNGNIEFKNVTFSYPDGTQALKKININIEGGKTIALVGSSGSGKTTLMNLIPRFYNLNDGVIEIDGQNINKVSLNSLRKNIALVSQDIRLFDDSIKSNIMFGNLLATEEDIIKACKNAAAHEFIMELSDGYNTTIGENGAKLSGGQKQRISIARAMIKNSPIILLDEATSSLDTESETKVKIAISNLIKGKTTIIIAHRLSTIQNADKIYVINNGQVAEEGTHQQLMEKSIIYKNLYNQQIYK